MNLGKLQDGEHGKRKKACGNRKKKKTMCILHKNMCENNNIYR